MNNPFTLTFGKQPQQFVPRIQITETVIRSFSQQNPPNQVFIITGVRGSGKTVMLSSFTSYFKAQKDWVVVNLRPDGDLLQDFAAKLYDESSMTEIFRNAKISLSNFGIGVEISGSTPINSIETAITRMLKKTQEKNKRVLIAIDEITNTETVRAFASVFQLLLREDLPVYLLMTGLPENVDLLQNNNVLTFLYRAPKMFLGPLNLSYISSIYNKSIPNITEADANEMAIITKGYPYAFQLLGYFTCENNGDYHSAEGECKLYLEEYVYEKIWAELSPVSRQILYETAKSETGQIKEIREKLNIKPNQISPYRDKLIRKGIISGEDFGKIKFMLPYFSEFVVRKYSAMEL